MTITGFLILAGWLLTGFLAVVIYYFAKGSIFYVYFLSFFSGPIGILIVLIANTDAARLRNEAKLREIQAQYPSTRSAKQGSILKDLALLVFFILVLIFCYRYFFGGNNSSQKVTYIVDGNHKTYASITVINNQGGTEQADVHLPYQRDLHFPSGSYVSILAQDMPGAGYVSCQILLNDQPWISANTSTMYGIASCNGIIGQ